VSKANEPELTPVVHIDSLWTKREEDKVPGLVKRYQRFMPGDDDDRYSSGIQKERPMQREWLDKALPQTRFFTSTGAVLDLNSFQGKKSVCVVVMRGFAGQVCVYCSTQTRVLAEQVEAFKNLDNEVIIVYPGPAETIPMFYKAVVSVGGDAKKLTIVLDVNLNLVIALNISKDLASPSSLILDKSGQVVYGYKGQNMGDRPSAKELLSYVKRIAE
jgi:peroxiredoxin